MEIFHRFSKLIIKKQNKKIATKDFDRRFDNDEDMANFLDVKKAQAHKKLFVVRRWEKEAHK